MSVNKAYFDFKKTDGRRPGSGEDVRFLYLLSRREACFF